MAEQALSTIGVVFGWGLGTMTEAPESWKQIEECISIGSVTLSQDKLDATPLESSRKKYVGGHADTGGELQTVFNDTDTFDAQWAEMLAAYDSRTVHVVLRLPPVKEKHECVHRGAGRAPDAGICGGKRTAVHNHKHAGGSPGSGHRSETGGAGDTGELK